MENHGLPSSNLKIFGRRVAAAHTKNRKKFRPPRGGGTYQKPQNFRPPRGGGGGGGGANRPKPSAKTAHSYLNKRPTWSSRDPKSLQFLQFLVVPPRPKKPTESPENTLCP